ncbi:hypothetical protein [uncultured Legionella sp.]|uniref:hypothetical protein n=1 Tax=uncultured Legionella sp. TaxID=210934 RepID=UPI00262EEB5B|nr:hypothetical protein [uncultured Legionella sp.]
MKQKENIYQTTEATFFYATAPLRFSFECFTLKYSGKLFAQTASSLMSSCFQQPQNIADFIMTVILAPIFIIASIQMAALLTLPFAVAELAVGALAIIPALAIAIATLPVMTLLALSESVCELFSEPDLDYNDGHELS